MQNPPPIQTPPPVQTKSSTGLDENIAALLTYVAGWVSGLVFFLIEKDSRLVRFHGMQSLLLNAAAIVIFIVLWIVWIVFFMIGSQISGLLSTLFSLIAWLLFLAFGVLIFGAVIFAAIKAYQKQYFKLPIIGNFAEKFSQK